MFPKGTVTAAVAPAEKPPVTPQKDSTVVYLVDSTDAQAGAVNESYWRTQRIRVCACAVVLTTLIVVAGTLGAIAIVITHKGAATTEPHTSLNRDREPLLGNEVPLPKLPEPTIRIKIDDGGLFPPWQPATPDLVDIDVKVDTAQPLPLTPRPTIRIKIDDGGLLSPAEPTIPDLIAIGDVTDDISEPAFSLSSSDHDSSSADRSYYGRTYVSSSFPYDGYYANGQQGTPPWEQSNWIGPSQQERDEADAEVSGDGQEGSAEPAAEPNSYSSISSYSSSDSDTYHGLSEAPDAGIVPYSSNSGISPYSY